MIGRGSKIEWTPQELDFLRENMAKLTYQQIADHLGRTACAVKGTAFRGGMTNGAKFFSAEDVATVKEWYRKIPTSQLAAQIGRSLPSVYQLAVRLGLTENNRIKITPAMRRQIMEWHGFGWSDAAIARQLEIDRRTMCDIRRKLGLASNACSPWRRRQVAVKTREQLDRLGLKTLAELRVHTFRERATAAGWPSDLRPRAVQILNALWERGPMTRHELADAIGMPWKGSSKSLVSNDAEGCYLGHLMNRGLVVKLNRAKRMPGRGHSVSLYTLPLWIERGSFNMQENQDAA